MTTLRSVPLAYAELSNAIDGGVFPSERDWIDFKRRLYPENPGDGASRARVTTELAKDMASMAVHGGYLVYGVRENKAQHTFHVDEMPLEVGLHETVEAVARSRITPPLYVVPTLVKNPQPDKTTGFLVVHVPPSPDAPHMADSIYWGRSETGKVRLADSDVERLIVLRGRQAERLREAMKDTASCDPARDQEPGTHFYFTAVPATGWPEMFADYAKDHASRVRLMQLCNKVLNKGRRTALGGMVQDRRSHQVEAGWLQTWANQPPPSQPNTGRALGVDDNGVVRFINFTASGPPMPDGSRVVFEVWLVDEVVDMLYLMAALADDVGYTGSWYVAVHLDHLQLHRSQLTIPHSGGAIWVLAGAGFEAPAYTKTTTASGEEVREKPEAIAVRLMRSLMRGLGSEGVFSHPPYSPNADTTLEP